MSRCACCAITDDLPVAKKLLSEAIDLIPVALNDAWLRDIGPTFVIDDGALIAVDWQFNGWGQNTEFEWGHDDTIAARIAQWLDIRVERADIVNEGGGLHVDGHGTVLLTDTVQLDPDRNPSHDRDSIALQIHHALGTHRAIWLPRGLWRDNFLNGTKGHVDIVACFAPDGRLLLLHRQTERRRIRITPLWDPELIETIFHTMKALTSLALPAPLPR